VRRSEASRRQNVAKRISDRVARGFFYGFPARDFDFGPACRWWRRFFFSCQDPIGPPSKRVFGAPPYSIHDLVEGADDEGYV
jgi:hypothetical protein